MGNNGLNDLRIFNLLNKEKGRYVNHYLINKSEIGAIKKILVEYGFKQLEVNGVSKFNFDTTYYDFPGDLFLASGGAKIRLRKYPNGDSAIEGKVSTRGGIQKKERITKTRENKILLPKKIGKILFPLSKSLQTKYYRMTFFNDKTEKVTIDTNLNIKHNGTGNSTNLSNIAIIEVKSFKEICEINETFQKIGLKVNNDFSKTNYGLAITNPTVVDEIIRENARKIFKLI